MAIVGVLLFILVPRWGSVKTSWELQGNLWSRSFYDTSMESLWIPRWEHNHSSWWILVILTATCSGRSYYPFFRECDR